VTRYKINDNKTFSWYSDTAKGSLPIEEKVTFYNSPHIFRTDEIDVRVKKVWKNDDTSTRPNKVTVELYRDGKYYDTVTLSEKNNWTYRWEDLDEDYNWTVKEVNVADGYEVSYKQRGNTTTITNSGRMLDDDGMLWWPVPVLLGAGAVLIVAGKRTSRRKDDEE
ncbi:MAG: Cna B-type domain-containing protein, partial [Oscillospiraceae bacterium]|nr:Cna B-type domain-containing protein [Oscillospiraceae bacterium]